MRQAGRRGESYGMQKKQGGIYMETSARRGGMIIKSPIGIYSGVVEISAEVWGCTRQRVRQSV